MYYKIPMFCQLVTLTPQVYQPQVLPEISISLDLPQFSYSKTKSILIPFDLSKSNNGCFNSCEDAIKFIANHCLKYHNSFSRQLAREYSIFCHVKNFETGKYEPLSNISKRKFNSIFNKISKFLST